MRIVDNYWLQAAPQFSDELRRLQQEGANWKDLAQLAASRLDFVQTTRLDRMLQKLSGDVKEAGATVLKLAMLGSSTADHLLPSLRIAALRRQISLQTYVGDYGLYRQALQDPEAGLFEFAPDVLLFAFHAQHLLGNPDPRMDASAVEQLASDALDQIRETWRLARVRFQGQIIQQAVLPSYRPLMGLNEYRLASSGLQLIDRINRGIREMADEYRVDVLAIDNVVAQDGIDAWHDPVLWHRAKQEISPAAAPAYGDLVLRLMAARSGRSSKCLVLDLDNTLWGGVIGDDGLEGIKLGQGSALGEAFVEFQSYARDLARRGVILAVCSKNDADNARSPFERHPDMVLKMGDIACFVANWTDKAANIRHIAEQLNIGIDSLVFVDDNPFERNIVRRELPMVNVPELPEDPALYSRCIADAGYFESVQLTPEDFERGQQYQANMARENLRASHTDLKGYLRSLQMELIHQPFDRIGLKRIVQLINKTNQFNLTTRRYTEDDVLEVMNDPRSLTLQLRLIDQFGDNGIIGIVIGRPQDASLRLDTWLMSCRVLGRQVEETTMNLVASEAMNLGFQNLIGEYLPTKKNGMVRDHYAKLGFSELQTTSEGATTWRLDLGTFQPFESAITTTRSTS